MSDSSPIPIPSPPRSDEAMVEAVRRGERGAFEIMMRRHNQRLYRVARSLLRDDAEAEEVVQQTWIQAWQNLEGFRGAARLSTWLNRIAVNECLMRARNAGRRLALDDPEFEEPPMPTPTPQDAAELAEISRLLEKSVDRLAVAQRAVFMLREVEGLSTAETAESLGVSEEVVKTTLHRARRSLREDLLRRVGDGGRQAFGFGSQRCDRLVERVLNVLRPP